MKDLKHKWDQIAPSNNTCDHNKNIELSDYNIPPLGIQGPPGLKPCCLWLDQSLLHISGFMLQQLLSAPNFSCTSCCFLPLLLIILVPSVQNISPLLPPLGSYSRLKFTCPNLKISCLSSVFLWYPVHTIAIIILQCFKIACLCDYLLALVTQLCGLTQ